QGPLAEIQRYADPHPPPPGEFQVGKRSRRSLARIRTCDVEVSGQAAGEIRSLLQPEIIHVFGTAKLVESVAGTAGEDEHRLTDEVCSLSLLKRAVLHRREKVLQPFESPGIEFVPEHHRRGAREHLVPYLVKSADQVFGVVELRKVELQDGVFLAKHAGGDLFQAERFAGTRRAENGEAQRLLPGAAVTVHEHELAERAQRIDLMPVEGLQSPEARAGHPAEPVRSK